MKEDSEHFFCDAENDADARKAAAMYGGVVVRRATQEEIDAAIHGDGFAEALDAAEITVTEGMNPDRWGPNGEDLFNQGEQQ